MARIDDLLAAALKGLPAKPADTASQADKKRYSERVSEVVAQAIAEELRQRGLKGARPAPPGYLDSSGAERRMAGGLGAKKVDVTWRRKLQGYCSRFPSRASILKTSARATIRKTS